MKAEDFRTVHAVIALLAERFSKAFFVYAPRRKPLKVGIRQDLVAALDGALSERELRLGLGWYCCNKFYRAKLIKGAWRIDLDGNVAATISENLVPAAKTNAKTNMPSTPIGGKPTHPRNKATAPARGRLQTAM
jgi:sRNA-binding protein